MSQRPGEATEAMSVPAYASGPVQPPGWVLSDRYTVLDRLGSGGMADVFRAHDEQLDRDVAVKVFRTPVDEPGNAHTPERRETELHALAQLSHPNLITLYDANIEATSPAFLVTELVVGPNLAARIAEGPIPEDLARAIGVQIAEALAYVHASGMVHRDVKPANILLGTDGPDPETAIVRARLSDFGIVRVLDDARMTAAEFTLGTASYIAPEQARGADVGPPADVYALGLVLLETLTGRRSFDGPMHEAVAARLVRGPEIPPGLPQPWPGLLAAMTASDPVHRPSAAQVADSLRTSAAPVFAPLPMAGAVPAPMTGPAMSAGPTAATAVTGPISAAMPGVVPLGGPPGPPPGDYLPDVSPASEPLRRSRRTAALVAVAALALLAAMATAALLVFKPASHTADPAGTSTTAPTASAGNGAGGQSGSAGGRHGGSAPAAGPVAAVTDSSSAHSGGASDTGAPSRGPASGSHSSSSPRSSAPGGGGGHPRSSSRPAPSSSHSRPSSSTSKSAPGGGHTSSAPSSSPVTSASAPTSSAAAAPSGGAAGSGQSG